MVRHNIERFQKNLINLVLGHGTKAGLVPAIFREGLVNDYNYACVGEGWEMSEDDHANVRIAGYSVASRTYPDPEGQWGDEVYSMADLVGRVGLEAALDQLEDCLSGKGWCEEFDVADPAQWNLVIVGPVPVQCLLDAVVR